CSARSRGTRARALSPRANSPRERPCRANELLEAHRRTGLEGAVAHALNSDRADLRQLERHLAVEGRVACGIGHEAREFGDGAAGPARLILLIDHGDVLRAGHQATQGGVNEPLALHARIQIGLTCDARCRKRLEGGGHLVVRGERDGRDETCGQDDGENRESTHDALPELLVPCAPTRRTLAPDSSSMKSNRRQDDHRARFAFVAHASREEYRSAACTAFAATAGMNGTFTNGDTHKKGRAGERLALAASGRCLLLDENGRARGAVLRDNTCEVDAGV